MLGMTEPQTIHYGIWDGSSTIICSYILSLLFVFKRRSEEKAVFDLLVPGAIVLLLVLYSPVSSFAVEMLPEAAQGIQIIRRFRWILLYLPVVTYCITKMSINMLKTQRVILLVVGIMLLVVSVYQVRNDKAGVAAWDRGNEQNKKYKIPQMAVDIGDLIMSENDVFFQESLSNCASMLVVDDNQGDRPESDILFLARNVRMYISPIQLRGVEINHVKEFDMHKMQYDYVLIPEGRDIENYFTKFGYEREKKYGEYVLLRASD